MLGIPVSKGRSLEFMGVEGTRRTAYVHPLWIVVGGHGIELRAGFVSGMPFRYGILGQSGFFDRFVVTMDNELEAPCLEIIPREVAG